MRNGWSVVGLAAVTCLHAQAAVFRAPEQGGRERVPSFIWIEAEQLADYGGWKLDSQFIHTMGSAYLLATGVGKPVRDACGSFTVSTAGTYTAWARTRDWLPEFSPGAFTLAIDNACGTPLGVSKQPGWRWEKAGTFSLNVGRHTLTLRDRSGYFARCDAVLLTADARYLPPDAPDACRSERERLSGIPGQPRDAGEFDVIVIGAGTAGCGAAIAAARNGARTALVHDRPVLGGNASAELGVRSNGAASQQRHRDAREAGLIEEAFLTRIGLRLPNFSAALQKQAEAETNLTVFPNERVIAVRMTAPGRIGAVLSYHTLTHAASRYRAKLFIDCTGDGWVGYYAGAVCRFGRESRAEFGERLAPEKPDALTMSGTLMLPVAYRAVPAGKPVSYVPPPWAAKILALGGHGRHINPKRPPKSGEWWMEHAGDINDLADPEGARDELVRISFGYWNYIKNIWTGKAAAAELALDSIPYMDARRETRRLVGDYLFREQDAESGRLFADRVAYGGWTIDIHHPRGIYSGNDGAYFCDVRTPVYTIPYRSLYSTNIANLFFAGRDQSSTHIGLGTTRLESTCSLCGQAAGTAAALCLRKGVLPRELGKRFIKDLQQNLLKDDQYIPALAEEDPADLARAAKASASSSDTANGMSPEGIIDGFGHADGPSPRLWSSDPAQKLPQWIALAFDRSTVLREIRLTFDTDSNAPVPNLAPCVRDYALELFDGQSWSRVAEVRGNYLRHRVHAFAPRQATQIRLTVTATHGAPSARVFEIRAY